MAPVGKVLTTSLPKGLQMVREVLQENDQLVASEVREKVAKRLNDVKRSKVRVGTGIDHNVPDHWWHRFEENGAWLKWLEGRARRLPERPQVPGR